VCSMFHQLFPGKYPYLFMGTAGEDVLLAHLIFILRQITSLTEYFMGQTFQQVESIFLCHRGTEVTRICISDKFLRVRSGGENSSLGLYTSVGDFH